MNSLVVWDEALLAYDLGEHPLDPVRVRLTMALANAYHLLERPGVTVHKPDAPIEATFSDVALTIKRSRS